MTFRKCKKCNSNQIKVIIKNSGQKIYHCKSCGYNFGQQEFLRESASDFGSKSRNLLQLFGGMFVFFVLLSFGFALIFGIDFVVVNTKYGQIIALIAGFLLFSMSPIVYILFMKNLFDNREGLFSRNKIGIFKRLGYFLAASVIGFFNLFLVGLMILFVPAASKDIMSGAKTECLTFIKVLDEQTSRGGRGARIYKNYVEFKKETGEIKKLADLKLDYQKIPPGSKICFDKFENLNIYSGDRMP